MKMQSSRVLWDNGNAEKWFRKNSPVANTGRFEMNSSTFLTMYLTFLL